MFNSKYMCSNGGLSIVMLVFGEVFCRFPLLSCDFYVIHEGSGLAAPRGFEVSHEKNPPTFHYTGITGWLYDRDPYYGLLIIIIIIIPI